MVRHFPYLHNFEIKCLTLDKEYIDYQLSQEFESLRDLIEYHIKEVTGRTDGSFNYRTHQRVTVCHRPYISLIYTHLEILKRWIDVDCDHQIINRTNYRTEFGNNAVLRWRDYELWSWADNSLNQSLLQMQNIGLKSNLKKLNADKKFDIIHGLITQKTKQNETSK